MGKSLIARNREQDLYLLEEGRGSAGPIRNVYFVPQGWVDDFSKAAGMEWGRDATRPEDEDGSEIYCYAPTESISNSPIETLWVKVPDLERMTQITEEQAKEIHPALFEALGRINQEGA